MSNRHSYERTFAYQKTFVTCAAIICALVSGYSWASPNKGCPTDRPCFNGEYQNGNSVVFEFTGVTGWDFYNIRYRTTGGQETQVENRSGIYTINNVQPDSTYTISVQGCNSRILASSRCSPWVQGSVTTSPAWSRLQLKHGGQYLDAEYCSTKVSLHPGSDHEGGACQLWRLVPAGSGWSRLQLKHGGQYLDAKPDGVFTPSVTFSFATPLAIMAARSA